MTMGGGIVFNHTHTHTVVKHGAKSEHESLTAASVPQCSLNRVLRGSPERCSARRSWWIRVLAAELLPPIGHGVWWEGRGEGGMGRDPPRSGRQLVMPTAQCDPRDRDSRGTREHTSAFKNTREGAGGRICRCFFKIHMLENSMEMWSRQPRTKRAELCFHLCYLPRALSSHFHSSSWFCERARKVEELGHIRLGPSSRG